MGLGVVGLQADRLAVRRDRTAQVARLAQGVAEVVVGLGVVGLEADRLAVRRDRTAHVARPPRALPRL